MYRDRSIEFIKFRVFRKKKKKKEVGSAEKGQKGYCPFLGLGHDKGFLCCDRAFWLYVATWSSMSRHGSQAVGGDWVATGVFLVATKCFLLIFYRDRGPPCVEIVFYPLS